MLATILARHLVTALADIIKRVSAIHVNISLKLILFAI
jgi:hypothetical protein